MNSHEPRGLLKSAFGGDGHWNFVQTFPYSHELEPSFSSSIRSGNSIQLPLSTIGHVSMGSRRSSWRREAAAGPGEPARNLVTVRWLTSPFHGVVRARYGPDGASPSDSSSAPNAMRAVWIARVASICSIETLEQSLILLIVAATSINCALALPKRSPGHPRPVKLATSPSSAILYTNTPILTVCRGWRTLPGSKVLTEEG